jgi:hypothetical protein
MQAAGLVSCPCCGAHRRAEPVKQDTWDDANAKMLAYGKQLAAQTEAILTLNEVREKAQAEHDPHNMMENIFWPVSKRT